MVDEIYDEKRSMVIAYGKTNIDFSFTNVRGSIAESTNNDK